MATCCVCRFGYVGSFGEDGKIMVKITLPDGNSMEFENPASGAAVAERIGPGLAKAALAVKINGELRDLTTEIGQDAAVEIVTAKSDPEASLDLIRHSCAHVMAEAICRLFPEAQLVYGPTVENGFYYDIDLDRPISTDDFEAIEAEMAKIVAEDSPFVRYEMGRDEALGKLEAEGNRYKIDNAQRAQGDVLSFYVTGKLGNGVFEDLCRGPHLPSTGKIGAFKVMSVAGAYFHGDATEKMLQRVYGTAFLDKKQLKQYLFQLEEAKKRDHRVLGKQLDLFSFQPEGPGFAFFHPKGMIVWNEMIEYWRQVHRRDGYEEIRTPIILNERLWHQSGHWDNYKENMYFTRIDEADFAVKPMNCPGGCLVYKSRPHSYRELPIRTAELGLVHRHEASGVLHGLLRVRQFTQDDAHIYCMPGQIEEEVVGVMNLSFEIYRNFGLEDIRLELSTMPEKHIGSEEIWERATAALQGALESQKVDFAINPGDGAFYGPKIDFHVRDCLGRTWQLGTIQLDFSMPERFDMTYVDRDNVEKRPVMIHRAILGSLERFLGILIEHYGGAFPLWLAPEQVRLMPISEKTNDYAENIAKRFRQSSLRFTIDRADDKINAKIKRAHEQKLPFMLVMGPAEQETGTVTVRIRGCKEQLKMKVDDFLAAAERLISLRSPDLSLTP
ncbi:MAG: threonine--tRNA ligase [Sedimentisphaerales bacterium]|nr:threonine--tRNA ligase [Sedimentisphaerales bacterium]